MRDKICPIMTRRVTSHADADVDTYLAVIVCCREECALWIEANTCDHDRDGCVFALAPQMVNGLFRD